MAQWTEMLKSIALAEFAALALMASFQWWRHRSVGASWAAWSFSLLAVVAVFGRFLAAGMVAPSTWLVKVLVVVLLLVPFCFYRFAATFDRPRARLRFVAIGVTAGVIAATVALPYFPLPGMPRLWWFHSYRIAVACQWGFLFSFVAIRLWRAGANQPRAARNRMRLLATGAAGLDVQIILATLGLTTRPAAALISQVSTVIMAGLFSFALVLPATVRYWWRRQEDDALQMALADLVKFSSVEEIAGGLLPHVAHLIGASHVVLVDAGGDIVASYADVRRTGAAEDRQREHRKHPGHIASVEMRFGLGHHLVVRTSPYMPFFGRDELRMLTGIGDLLGLAIERCALAEREGHAKELLAHQALHDALTGLPNRTLFHDRLSVAIAGIERHRNALAVMFIDLDRFKLINDGLDHAAGDCVLTDVARRLVDALRAGDTVARFGGDEFVVLTEVHDADEALALANRLCDVIADRVLIGERDLSVTASIGVVVTAGGEDPAALVRDADAAMYQAKEAGRNRVELFSEHFRADAIQRLDMERRLRRAVVDDELQLVYQPIFRLADGRPSGVEALLRWNHPRRGLLLPAEFIPLAEESDLISVIGTWVLEAACRQMAEWRSTIDGLDHLKMWVNISGGQFQRTEPAASVARILATFGLDPAALGIEITETVYMANSERVAASVRDLEALGVGIAIDDFGTGFSSLGYLTRFPVDVLKIDGSFVGGIGREPDTAVVTACLALARSLGLEAVAECVETEAQLDWLRAAGCDYVQGHHLSLPLSSTEATLFFRQFAPARGRSLDPARRAAVS